MLSDLNSQCYEEREKLEIKHSICPSLRGKVYVRLRKKKAFHALMSKAIFQNRKKRRNGTLDCENENGIAL